MSRLEEDNLTKKLKHNGFWLYLFSFLIAPSGYLLKLMIARELSIEDIGLFYAIIGFIEILSIYNDLGLVESLQYFLPKYVLRKNLITAKKLIITTIHAQFITGIFFFIGLYFGSNWLADNYFKSENAAILLKIFSIYFIIYNLYQVITAITLSLQQVKWTNMLHFIKSRSLVLFVFFSIFIFDSFNLLLYTYIRLGGVILSVIIGYMGLKNLCPRLFLKKSNTNENTSVVKKRFTYGFSIVISNSSALLFSQLLLQILLLMQGKASVATRIYYTTFFTLINTITYPLIGYLFPLLTELREKKEFHKIRILYLYLILFVIIIGIVLGGIFSHFSPMISTLIYGTKFYESGVLFAYFAPWIFTVPIVGIILTDFASRGWIKERIILFLFSGITLISTALFLIPSSGLIGGVRAQIIGNIVFVCIAGYFYYKNNKTLVTSQVI